MSGLPQIKKKFIRFLNSFEWDNPRYVLLLTIATYLLFVIVRFVIFSLFTESCANGDEYTYKGMALSFFKTGDFYKLNYARKLILPNYLYPMLLSPAFFFGEHFYIFMKLINSLLINFSIFPVFLIGKEFMSYKKSYWVSAAVLCLPFFNIGYILMAESLYASLFLLAFYFFYKLFSGLQLKYAFPGGIAGALLYLAKPTALFFFITLLLTIITTLFFTGDHRQRKRLIYLTAVSICCLVTSILALNLIILGEPGMTLKSYSRVSRQSFSFIHKLQNIFDTKFVSMILSHISVFLMLYLLPFFVSIFALVKSVKEKAREKRTFLLMGLIFLIVMAVVIFLKELIFTRQAPDFRLTARFYFMIFPIFIISFAAFYNKIAWNKRQKITLGTAFVLTLLLNVFVFLPRVVFAAGASIPTAAHMDAVWIYISQLKLGPTGKILFALMQMTGFSVMLYYFLKKKKKLYPYLAFFLLTALIGNFAVLAKMKGTDNWRQKFRNNYYSFVSEKIPLNARDVALISYKPRHKWGYFSFWLHYDYTAKLRLKELKSITEEMLPENTRWVLINGDYNIRLPVKAHYRKGEYSIIRILKKNMMRRPLNRNGNDGINKSSKAIYR